MAFTATARCVDGLRHSVEVNGRHSIITDEPVALGGTDQGPAPHELLPAALASCIATTLATYAKTKGWEIGEPTVEVIYDTEARPRNFEIGIELATDLAPDQLRRLERAAESCPLRRALEGGFNFEEHLAATTAHA